MPNTDVTRNMIQQYVYQEIYSFYSKGGMFLNSEKLPIFDYKDIEVLVESYRYEVINVYIRKKAVAEKPTYTIVLYKIVGGWL